MSMEEINALEPDEFVARFGFLGMPAPSQVSSICTDPFLK